ncbi:MAG: hypothetical protein MJY60_07505 [Bacteroidales bacterium]|nr:hypothetical protein [Bacteroidales bacterium]
MFIFTDLFPEKGQGDLHVDIDCSLRSETDLINYIEKETVSPYLGHDNWDGFYDSITEMSWFDNINNFRILHEDLPQIEQIHLYLDILNRADVWWEIDPENVKIMNEQLKDTLNMQNRIAFFKEFYDMDTSQVPGEDHVIIKNFNVYFKKKDEGFVLNSLDIHSKDYRKRLYKDKNGLIRFS